LGAESKDPLEPADGSDQWPRPGIAGDRHSAKSQARVGNRPGLPDTDVTTCLGRDWPDVDPWDGVPHSEHRQD